MTWTPPVKALEWDILALEAMVDMEALGGAMEVWAWVTEVSGGVSEALEEATEDLVDMEDLEVLVDLDLHLMVLECPPMASEEDMEELAHTVMVVQVPFTGCQDLVGRVVIMHLLQPMVVSLLPMVPKNLLMALNHLLMVLSHLHMAANLLLMVHLVHKLNHNQAMVLVRGQPMMQLLRLMHLLPTAFLLAMGGNLLLMELRNLLMVLSHLLMVPNLLHTAPNLLHIVLSHLCMEVLSSNLSSSLLLYLRLDKLDQCNLCKLCSSSTRLVSLNVDA